MIKLLIRRFVKNGDMVCDLRVREAYGVLSGTLGGACNLFLFALKLGIGLFINSIAVISDAFNNLSDLGSSIVTVFGAKLGSQPKDREHPYGHGRYEYIASLVVAFIIFGVGLELVKSSIAKIQDPKPVTASWVAIGILTSSLLVKLWMFSFNRYIGRLINSSVNRAAAADSINDVIATGAIIAGTAAGSFLGFSIDGILGLIVSAIVIYSGFKIAKDSVNLLLGSAPDPELVAAMTTRVLEGGNIKGAHDLQIHDYGPGQVTASIHAEVLPSAGIVDIHEEIDRIEKRVEEELGISIVIHMDPIDKVE